MKSKIISFKNVKTQKPSYENLYEINYISSTIELLAVFEIAHENNSNVPNTHCIGFNKN